MALGTYIFLSIETNVNLDVFQWIPVTSFSSMIFIASCGALPIPYVIVSEILPDKVSICSTCKNDNISLWIILNQFSIFRCIKLDTQPGDNALFVHFMGINVCHGQSISTNASFSSIVRLHLFLCPLLLRHRHIFTGLCARNKRQITGRNFNYIKGGEINGQKRHIN